MNRYIFLRCQVRPGAGQSVQHVENKKIICEIDCILTCTCTIEEREKVAQLCGDLACFLYCDQRALLLTHTLLPGFVGRLADLIHAIVRENMLLENQELIVRATELTAAIMPYNSQLLAEVTRALMSALLLMLGRQDTNQAVWSLIDYMRNIDRSEYLYRTIFEQEYEQQLLDQAIRIIDSGRSLGCVLNGLQVIMIVMQYLNFSEKYIDGYQMQLINVMFLLESMVLDQGARDIELIKGLCILIQLILQCTSSNRVYKLRVLKLFLAATEVFFDIQDIFHIVLQLLSQCINLRIVRYGDLKPVFCNTDDVFSFLARNILLKRGYNLKASVSSILGLFGSIIDNADDDLFLSSKIVQQVDVFNGILTGISSVNEKIRADALNAIFLCLYNIQEKEYAMDARVGFVNGLQQLGFFSRSKIVLTQAVDQNDSRHAVFTVIRIYKLLLELCGPDILCKNEIYDVMLHVIDDYYDRQCVNMAQEIVAQLPGPESGNSS